MGRKNVLVVQVVRKKGTHDWESSRVYFPRHMDNQYIFMTYSSVVKDVLSF